MASTSLARATSALNAAAVPPSPAMIPTVASAAAALRSTQNPRAPWRANVTAVALPLPQPGPIEPAPTTIATLPLRRFIIVSLLLLFWVGTHAWLWLPRRPDGRGYPTTSGICRPHTAAIHRPRRNC